MFDLVAAVVNEAAGSRPDGEGASAKRVELAVLAGGIPAQSVGDRQPAQLLRVLQGGRVGKDDSIERDVLHTGLLGEPVVVAGVAFVGGDQIRAAFRAKGGDGVRLIHALDRPGADVDRLVLVARVEAVAGQAVILVSEGHERRHGRARNVDDRERVVLLQRHVGGPGIVGHGDVFRFEILRNGRVRTEDPDALIAQRLGVGERAESGRRDGPVRHVDDRHGAFGIDRVGLVVAVRLTLVGDEHEASVRRESQHVGQRADRHREKRSAPRREVGPKEDHRAGFGFRIALDGDRHHKA